MMSGHSRVGLVVGDFYDFAADGDDSFDALAVALRITGVAERDDVGSLDGGVVSLDGGVVSLDGVLGVDLDGVFHGDAWHGEGAGACWSMPWLRWRR